MKELKELTKELNEYAKSYGGEPEKISPEDAIRAFYTISNLYVSNEVDVLLFLAALNLCNAYAKQGENHDIYKFKKNIDTLTKILYGKNISDINICETNDKGNLYIFNIGNIQFSYHDEKKVDIDPFYYKEMIWDKIRKQPCSRTIFNECYNNKLTNMCITMTGKPFKILLNKLINDYHKKILTFEEILENIQE